MADSYGKPFSGYTSSMTPKPGTFFDPVSRRWITRGVSPMSYHSIVHRKGSGNSRSVFVHKNTEFWVLQNGHIECGNCHEQWCTDIFNALVANADGDDLWNNLEESYEMDIPMIPTRAQWARVVLEPSYRFKTLRVFEVNLLPPDVSDLADTTFVGHIHLGEGRIVIRSMIFDWFRSNVEVESLRCESSSHKYSAQMLWEQDEKNPEKASAQYWSVWAVGACLTCAAGVNSAFDDLVPENDKIVSVW